MADTFQPADLQNAEFLLKRQDDVELQEVFGNLQNNLTVLHGIIDSVSGFADGANDLLDSRGNKIVIPAASLVRQVQLVAETGVTAAGAATVSVGYSGGAAALVAATGKADLEIGEKVAGVPVGTSATMIYNTAQKTVQYTVATGPLTAGKVHVFIELYVIPS